MNARSILARLRAGDRLTPEEVAIFVAGLTDGTVSDAQAGAFAMGICLQGLDAEARTALTTSMRFFVSPVNR